MRAVRAAAALGALAALALAAGCTTTTSTSSGPVNEVRDRTNQAPSNDPADVARRARVRLELAAAYFSRGQNEVALEEVQRALQADPGLAPAYNLRGLIQAAKGEDRLAEESFRRAIALDARDPDAMHNFGWYLCQRRRFAEGDAQFEAALAVPQYREPARTLLARGVCQVSAGQLAQAEQSMQRAYQLEPGNPGIALNLANVLYRLGEFERARFYVRRVNAVPAVVSAQTLWLAMRIENKLGNRAGVGELGAQLRGRFPDSREALAYDRGQFDD